MKELDVLLERYVRLRLPAAGAAERQVLGRLLELPDPLLADYLFGHATAEEPALARSQSVAERFDGAFSTARRPHGTPGRPCCA